MEAQTSLSKNKNVVAVVTVVVVVAITGLCLESIILYDDSVCRALKSYRLANPMTHKLIHLYINIYIYLAF